MKRRSFFGGFAALLAAPVLAKDIATTEVGVAAADSVVLGDEPSMVSATPIRGATYTYLLEDAKELFPNVDYRQLPQYVKSDKGLLRIDKSQYSTQILSKQ